MSAHPTGPYAGEPARPDTASTPTSSPSQDAPDAPVDPAVAVLRPLVPTNSFARKRALAAVLEQLTSGGAA